MTGRVKNFIFPASLHVLAPGHQSDLHHLPQIKCRGLEALTKTSALLKRKRFRNDANFRISFTVATFA